MLTKATTDMKFDAREYFDRLREKMNDDDILGNAAQVAFYFSFALFPLLLFLTSLIGLILNDKADLQAELFTILAQAMPASAYDLVAKTMAEVTSSASGGKLTFGILITLWSASAGVDNMRGTLNEVYNLEETRSWFKAKLVSLLLTLGIGVLILIALGFLVYGSQVIGLLIPVDSPVLLEALEWIVILCLLLLAFALLYNFAPNHEPLEWKWISPGAVIGVVLWIVLSTAFRIYLRYFDNYSATYGSLGAMIILLFWLYLTALVILIGGAINAIFDERSGVKKEAQDPEQVKEEKSETGKKSKT
ncbi:MAG: YihY/virulence factor BrkB family protein [Pyrinomonadaceae bacterium]|nr:YihY/virulence factor BrkB family protein [Pyrinomonadaceae bacterium]